jgi:LAO/AO transport system kinase
VDLKRLMNPAKAAREAAKQEEAETWTPPVLPAVGIKGEGIAEIATALDRHFAYLEQSGQLSWRRRLRLRERVVDVVERLVRRRLWRDAQTEAWLAARMPELESGTLSPYGAATALLERSGALVSGTENSESE